MAFENNAEAETIKVFKRVRYGFRFFEVVPKNMF